MLSFKHLHIDVETNRLGLDITWEVGEFAGRVDEESKRNRLGPLYLQHTITYRLSHFKTTNNSTVRLLRAMNIHGRL